MKLSLHSTLLFLFGISVITPLVDTGVVLAQTPLETTTNLVVTGSQTGSQTGPLGTIFTLTATVTDAHGPVKFGQVTFYEDDPAGRLRLWGRWCSIRPMERRH
jgi:hypothetical protein